MWAKDIPCKHYLKTTTGMAILISEKVQFRERKLPETESDIIE